MESVTRNARKDASCIRTSASKRGARRVAKRAAKRIKVIKVIVAIKVTAAIEVISGIARQPRLDF